MKGTGEGVAVVIVHYGDSAPTCACLRSVLADSSSLRRRVIVVDNSNNFDLPVDLESAASVLHLPDNPGFGGGVRRGLDTLRGSAGSIGASTADSGDFDVILALNHDVCLRPGFFDALSRAFAEPEVGAVGGPVYLAASGEQLPRLWYAGGGCRRLSGTVWQSHAAADAQRARAVGFIPGTALAVRLQAWDATGGFDASYFLYHEDLDLCLRLRRAGWQLWFEPAMACDHHLGAATGSGEASPLYLEWMARNRLRPFHGRLYRTYLALVHSGWVIVKSLRLLLRSRAGERLRALWRGHLHALRSLGEDPAKHHA